MYYICPEILLSFFTSSQSIWFCLYLYSSEGKIVYFLINIKLISNGYYHEINRSFSELHIHTHTLILTSEALSL